MKKILPFLAFFSIAAFLVPAQTFAQQSCKGFRTQGQGGWGTRANGNNPGTYRDKNFAGAFPNSLTIGCTNKLVLTSSKAVENFLPSGTQPRTLPPGKLTDPGGSYRNVFAGQLVAAVLNVGFDLYDPDFSSNAIHLGDLIIVSGKFSGWTINQLIAEANSVIGGCGTSYKPSDLNDALDAFNQNYEDGTSDKGFTTCPSCEFVTNGVAFHVADQCYQLTGTDFHTAGSVFSNTPIDLSKSFLISANLNFGSADDGGDGIAFVLQNEGPGYLGNDGAGIGYHRFDGRNICMPFDNPGPVPSFITEFDTYENHDILCEDIGDPPGDHVGFMSKSDAYHTSSHALAPPQEISANIEDGKYHHVSFSWNATNKTMTVRFTVSGIPLVLKTFTYTADIVNTLFGGNPLVYFGFTASNGASSTNRQTVCIQSACAAQSGIQESQTDVFADNAQALSKSFTVQPNPSNGQFNIRLDGNKPGTGKLVITNANGVIVETRKISILSNMQTMSFDLSKHGKGVYFVHLGTGEGEQVQKIIIQ